MQKAPKLKDRVFENAIKTGANSGKANEPNINDKEDFWRLVEENSKNLHSLISNNYDLQIPNKEIVQILLKNNFNFSMFNPINFSVSNLGKLGNTENKNIIEILESYVYLPLVEKRFTGSLYISMTTIGDNLCCGISFNTKVLSENFIKELKEQAIKIIDSIIQ